MATNPLQKLSGEQIFDTALELIEHRGVASLNMRALARALGVGTMTLYNYVATKDELLDEVASHAVAAWQFDDKQDQPAREQLAAIFDQIKTALEQQPGVLELLFLRSVEGPAIDALRETVVAILIDAGVSGRAAMEALGTLYAYTLGFAATSHRARIAPDRFAGVSAADFPHLNQIARHYEARVSDKTFKTGLQALLDGLDIREARAADGAGSRRRRSASRVREAG